MKHFTFVAFSLMWSVFGSSLGSLTARQGEPPVSGMKKPERLNTVACYISSKAIPLHECSTDALGYPVHENCYVEMLADDKRKREANLTLRNRKGPTVRV
jgi:hypothetical protein